MASEGKNWVLPITRHARDVVNLSAAIIAVSYHFLISTTDFGLFGSFL